VIALALVLFSIVIISVAPSLISAITVDRTDLNKSIEDKKEIIRELENELKNKNLLIISNGRSCTDEILKREQEFIGMLGQIKKDLKKKEEEKPLIYESLRIGNNDSTLKMMILPTPEVNVVTKKSNLKPIIKKIEMMEEKIHH
jgi:hypothetical protein